MGIYWTCCVCEKQVNAYMYDTEERMCHECLNHEDEYDYKFQRPNAFIRAWHRYCMESIIFRIFVKLGWRN